MKLFIPYKQLLDYKHIKEEKLHNVEEKHQKHKGKEKNYKKDMKN